MIDVPSGKPRILTAAVISYPVSGDVVLVAAILYPTFGYTSGVLCATHRALEAGI